MDSVNTDLLETVRSTGTVHLGEVRGLKPDLDLLCHLFSALPLSGRIAIAFGFFHLLYVSEFF